MSETVDVAELKLTDLGRMISIVRLLIKQGWISKAVEIISIAKSLLSGVIPPELENTIRMYQQFHGLEETGKLDGATFRSIEVPRFCSHTDVLPATMDNKWPQKNLKYHIVNPNGFPGLTADQVLQAAQYAWKVWIDVCGIEPTYTTDKREAQVIMTCAYIDGNFGTLAWSELANGSMTPKNQRYDNGEKWVFDVTPQVPGSVIDLARVMAHEIGHVIGIGHIANGNLLAPMYDRGVSKPQPGDIAEAVARYGPPKVTPPPTNPVPTDWKVVISGKGDKPQVLIE